VATQANAISAREWGLRAASSSPAWSEAKWRRVCATLGVEYAEPDRSTERDGDQHDAAQPALGAAA